MKAILLAGLWLAVTAMPVWLIDFAQAKEVAAKENRLILLNFSGSDWCAPCIRLKKEVFTDFPTFDDIAGAHLVLVNADFPRNKKNQLAKQQQAQNETLADKYNPEGKFPFTLLLRADGSIIQSWDGFPKGGAAVFTSELRKLCETNLSK